MSRAGSGSKSLLRGGTTLLFADARGFRFAGRLVEPTGGPVNLTLIRTSDPVGPKSRCGHLRPDVEERKRLAMKLLDPEIERLLSGTAGVSEYHTLQFFARLDPTMHARAGGEGQVLRAHDARA